jgi:hypothetical protein
MLGEPFVAGRQLHHRLLASRIGHLTADRQGLSSERS